VWRESAGANTREGAVPEVGEQRSAFLVAEYREAANAYFEGTNIGWTGLRFYVTTNAFFATAFSVLTGFKEQPLGSTGHNVRFSPIFALSVSISALLLSVAILLVLSHYFNHLENCRLRCQQIEAEWGG
jgi:hypothetical protein